MKQEEFSRRLASVAPDMPKHFSDRVDQVLEGIIRQEENEMKEATKRNLCTGSRALAFALAAVLLLGSVAFAASQWGIFDSLGYMLGSQPSKSPAELQKNLHQETVNGVEITIHEAGYDGRTLFLQYSYRLPEEPQPFAVLDEKGQVQEGVKAEDQQKLEAKNVGWWIDHFWIDGECMDMAADSGAVESGTLTPGQIMKTEYWRLDNVGVYLKDQVEIALPIGEKQPLADYVKKDHPEKYDENGQLLKPEKGLVTFTLDVGDAFDRVVTLTPNQKTVTPLVTARCIEAAFTPLMTYITLDLEGNAQALNDYKEANGEGFYDENGVLRWPFTSQDVYHDYILSLELVDGSGKLLFPGHQGFNGVGDKWAEFLYPSMEKLPDELWLAPMTGDVVDMTEAIRIK